MFQIIRKLTQSKPRVRKSRVFRPQPERLESIIPPASFVFGPAPSTGTPVVLTNY